jgi:hypothetical protein
MMTTSAHEHGCDAYAPLMDDFVDGALDVAVRGRFELHLSACPLCQRVAADLAQIRQVAGALPPRSPRADAWQRIAHELSREPRFAQPTPAPLRTSWRVWLAAAAVIVLATASTVWFVRQSAVPTAPQQAAAPAQPTPSAAPVHPAPDNLVRNIDEELRAAELHYEKAITGLEQIAKAEQSALDPELAATLQKNLGVIDQAIKESRTAIKSQPASALAQDSLFEALRRKVALLEDTITLISVMRQGDEAGTARAIKGLSKL